MIDDIPEEFCDPENLICTYLDRGDGGELIKMLDSFGFVILPKEIFDAAENVVISRAMSWDLNHAIDILDDEIRDRSAMIRKLIPKEK